MCADVRLNGTFSWAVEDGRIITHFPRSCHLCSHERVNFHWCGVVPVRYAPLSVRLMHRFPLTSESIVPLQPRQRASAILDLVGCVPVLLL